VEEAPQVDAFDLLEPVEILSKLPKTFFTQIVSIFVSLECGHIFLLEPGTCNKVSAGFNRVSIARNPLCTSFFGIYIYLFRFRFFDNFNVSSAYAFFCVYFGVKGNDFYKN